MTPKSWTRKLFYHPVTSPIRRRTPRTQLYVEKLEDRLPPALFTVLNSNDTGSGSLRDAILQANANSEADTILFGDGSGTGGTNFLDVTPDVITLTSGAITFAGDTALTTVTGSGANLLTVSGGGTQQVFWINSGISASLTGMTITGGQVTGDGGGVNNFGTLTMTDCTVSGNSATSKGGGLANQAGATATLTGSTISGNMADFQGGGIQNQGSLTLIECTVSGNSATNGAGSSGGINTQGGAAVLIAVDTTISGNSANFGGGLSANGTATLTNCTISGNSATTGGGGINSYTANMTLTNCTVSGNQTGPSGNGGGIILNFGSLSLLNLTISGNTANSGGGIYHTANGTLTVRNTIVSANTATTGPDIVGAINTDNGFNLFGAALSGTTFGTGNVYSDSPLLAALGNYGGPTLTMIPQFGSPAIGAGDNTGGPSTDQRGAPRVPGAGATIGAVDTTAYLVTNTNNSGAGSLRQAVLDANIAPTADYILFSSFFNTTQTITLSSGQLTFTDAATTTITGPGANLLSVSGNNASRVFLIDTGKSAALSGLTVTGGSGAFIGGGIRNDGTVTLTGIAMKGNSGSHGGGFGNTGTATVTNSTFSANVAVNEGGGLENYGILTITNSTFATNTSARGGGIANAGGGTLTLTNGTLSGNSASSSGGGIDNIAGTVLLTNTIVANASSGGSISGSVSGSNNLIGLGGSGGLVNGVNGNLVGVSNPGLGVLANNGGTPQTIALLPNSPALNAGNSASAPATDQRGQTRFGNTDIGAYEYLFKVVNTADSGLGSLRQAMIAANAAAGADTIVFRIGSGAKTISPGSALPNITDRVTIDGTTQPGFIGAPLIELRGDSAGPVDAGLSLSAAGSVVRGLVINRFTGVGADKGAGIDIRASNITIAGSYIGTTSAGTADAGNSGRGVYIHLGATGMTVGGTTAADRNVISGNDGDAGVFIGNASGNTVLGNYIGLNAAGNSAIPNSGAGVFIDNGANNNTIGGAAGNFISGNSAFGVRIRLSSSNTISGNTIGLDVTGAAKGNAVGIAIESGSSNIIGGTAAGAGNTIASNTLNGLALPGTAAADNFVRRNSFFGNGGLAIDVGNDGATLNTPGADLNAPVLTSVRTGVGVVEVEGFARPGKSIEFYISDSLGQGRIYLATATEGSPADSDATSGSYGPGPVNGNVVGIDTANRFHFTIPVPADFVVGSKVTAVTIGSISEFAAAAAGDISKAFGAPVVDAGSDATLVIGQTFVGRGSFSDIDSDFWPTAEVNYGDGSGWQTLTLDPPVYAPQSAEDFTIAATVGFALSHRYAVAGNYFVSVRVTDDSGATGGDALVVDMENAPPSIDNSQFVVTPQRISEGGTVLLTGTFADASTVDTHTVRIIWGDGTESFATVDETNRTFSADHVYRDDNLLNTASDVYPLQAIITDGAGASGNTVSGLFFVQVDNVRPSALTLTTDGTTIDEGDTFVLGGSFVDPGVLDTHRVAITWGDGSPDTIVSLPSGVTSFAGITHQYRNNPTAATSYAISVRVTDDDEPLTPVTAGTSVTVNNVIPSSVSVTPSLATIDEHGTISLSGSFADLGTLDAHTVIINWGDGSGTHTLNFAAGVTSFSGITHRYLDNPAGLPNGSFPITVTVADTDQPFGLATGVSSVTVRNVNPSIGLTLSQSAISENGTIVVIGSYVDPGSLDRHTVRINWGDGTFTNAKVDSTTRTFHASHRYSDDNPSVTPSDVYSITATVTDNDLASGSTSQPLTVNNLAPAVQILPGIVNSLSGVQLVSTVTDVSPTDTFTYAWSVTPVGGGTPITGNGPTITFAAAANTSYTATLTVTDDDGGATTTTLRADVLTEFADTYIPTVVPSGVSAIVVLGLGGADVIDGSALSIPLILDGGADIDTLTGGSADDVIILHRGNDSGFGLGGNDRFLLTPNSTLTVEDGSGNNTLDFGASNFGITFDLTRTDGDLQDVHPLTPLQHLVSVNDLGTGQFGTLVGSTFDDSLTAASNSTLFGDSGNDKFFVNANTAGTTISGGADADQLTTSGAGISNIDFRGDDGADLLTNNGIAVTAITFTGGSDADQLLNNGSISLIDFKGDDGADILTNLGSIATITYTGGSDGDLLQNTGTVTTRIDFQGDDGADILTNTGSVAIITFTGGSDGDLLQTTAGSTATLIDFRGDDGADRLLNDGSIATITFTGGSDGDLLQNSGTVATKIDFLGDDGADILTNTGSVATITFTGGSDGDLLQTTAGSAATLIDFRGDDGADRLLNDGTIAIITFTGGSDGDLLQNSGTVATKIDFQGDDGADLLTNTGSAAIITFTGGADGDLLQTATGSTSTLIDFRGDDGADTLTNLGTVATITFTGGSDGDLLQTSTGSSATIIDFRGDDGADTLLNNGSVATITFTGGSDGDLLQNTGTVATKIDFLGDDGADTLLNNGSVATITFTGGSDGDLLQNGGTVATKIDFQGDDGADTLTNLGSVAIITFSGGADGDLLQTSIGSAATVIDFRGDSGTDTLTNFGSVATMSFAGGTGDDRLRNYADGVNLLSFHGDDGADLLVNTGSNVATIDFLGDDGADILLNTGINVTKIDFQGDDGADILQNDGTTATITFTGGSDGDQLLNNGTGVTRIDFQGDDGADILTNFGSVATITFTGGADGDLLQTSTGSVATLIDFRGDDGADTLTSFGSVAIITFTGGSDGDLLQNAGTVATKIDFQGDDGADILQNIGSVATITFTGGSNGDLLQNGGTVTTKIDFQGDDGADTLTNIGSVAIITFTGGSDGDLLENGGTVATKIDFQGDDGADTLTNVGTVAIITFTGGSDGDLLQTSTGSTATIIDFKGDDGADTLLNFGSTSTITFTGGSDGDLLQNNGTVATRIDFLGDDGADTLINLGPNVANITFTGGADGDLFWNAGTGLGLATFFGDDGADTLVNDGTSATKIDFRGDDGADILTNNGSVATITFTGGSDGDLLQNTGTVVTKIDFQGDDGADTLTNLGTVATITFTGGSDGDLLQTTAGSSVAIIDFRGDDGADNLLNTGTVGTITFTGGSDGDLLQNGGTVATIIDFRGDDGADTLINSGTGSVIIFTAGADDDLYIERGGIAQITYDAGRGNDRILYSGNGSATFNGGTGSDEYLFFGSAMGSVTILEDSSLLDTNSLDFAGYTAGGVTVNLSQTTVQTVASGLALTLNSSTSIANVVGTSFADTLIGNDRNNVLTGAALGDDRVSAGAQWDGVTQWVYLDFDTETESGERLYTAAERDAIQARIAADFHGPDVQNPWFHVQFTQNRINIPSVLLNAEQYATLNFNRTPNSNRPGGEASELDFRNTNLGGTASIQVNGLTGGANQPAPTSENIVALAAKIGAHELAHLMGVRHADSFGPIGYGLHSPPGTGSFKPAINGPVGAYETYNHLIGSPATIGTDRFNDLNNLYFGEREAVKLSFAERGTVVAEQTGTHGTIATAQPLTLAALTVPTTSQGLNAGSSFQVAALAVTGQINLAGEISENDFYTFTGRKGDLISIEVISTGLANAGMTIDSVVRLYDASGNLVSYYGGLAVNDDQFEPTDSLLYDVLLHADGTYYIEVDTFTRNANDENYDLYDPLNPLSPLNPLNVASILNPLNPDFDPVRLASFLDVRDDTDTGRYELFVYRFGASNATDAGDNIQGGAGDDTLLGGMGGDSLQGGTGNDYIGLDNIGTAITAPVNSTANESTSVTVLTVSGTQTVSWQIAASNGQVIANGQGTNISFVPNDNGIYTVNYTVLGSQGDTWSDSTIVTVLNVAPTAVLSSGGAVNEGSLGNVNFSSQSDTGTDQSTLRYAFDFDNDGTFDLGSGTYSGGLTSANAIVPASYLSNGPSGRVITGRIIDKDGGYTDYTTSITVNNVAPAVTVGGIAVLTTPTLSRSGSFSDPGADSWSATVDYGDGSGTQPLSLNADKTFLLNHTYTAVGIFTVTVTVSDDAATSTATFTLIHNIPATIEAGPDLVSDEGALVSLSGTTFENLYVTGMHSATINWGDGTATVAGSVSQTLAGSGITGTISGTHRYADNGTYSVTVMVTTPYGAVSSDMFAVTVSNVAPTLAVLSGPSMVIPGQPLAYSSTFSDPGFDNPLNVGGEIAETFTGTINWGDGSTTEAAVVTWVTGSSGVSSTGLAVTTHTYVTTGIYTITLTLQDNDGGSTTRSLAVTVTSSAFVLAPTGSEVLTVTGNGKIVLPGVIEVNSNSSDAIKVSGYGHISASQIHVVGGFSVSGNATISQMPTTGGAPTSDPLASLTAPSGTGTIGSVNLSGNSSLTISPGRYSQIKVSGNASLTMLPGVYVVLGGGVSITGNANVTGDGVMIYNAGNSGTFGGIAVTGNGMINLSAPSVGQPYAGILFFQARDNTRALAVSGNGVVGMRGTIYAPAAQLALSGNAALKAAIVVRSATVSGNASSTLMNGTDIGVADLAKTLLGADMWIYVDNTDGAFTPAALSRIDSAIAGMNALLGAHSVYVSLVPSIDQANVVLDVDPTTPLGGANEGVLGYFAESEGRGMITLVQGWNWYAGEDPANVGSSQFDFQTIVTHELGHALGLGHHDNSFSVMHDELSSGTVRRAITEADLSIPEAEHGGGDPLIAAGYSGYSTLLPVTAVPMMVTPRRATVTTWFLAPSTQFEMPVIPAPERLDAWSTSEIESLSKNARFEMVVDEVSVIQIENGEGDDNSADEFVWDCHDFGLEFDLCNGIWVG
jgi:hypothetical protein